MSSPLGIHQTLELLDRLKSVVRDFAAREEKLSREHHLNLAGGRHRRGEAIEQQTARLAAAIQEAEAAQRAARAAINARQARRKTRVTRAHQSARKRALEAIDETEGRRKNKLQMETLQAGRDREAGLAAAETTHEDFKRQLAEEVAALTLLETTAKEDFKGYLGLPRRFESAAERAEANVAPDEYQLLAAMRERLAGADQELARFRKRIAPRFFKGTIFWIVLVLGVVPLVPLVRSFDVQGFEYVHAWTAAGALLVGMAVMYFFSRRRAAPVAQRVAALLGQARRLHAACPEKAATRHTREMERLENEHQARNHWIEQEWNLAVQRAGEQRVSVPARLDEKAAQVTAKIEAVQQATLQQLHNQNTETVARLKRETEARRAELTAQGEVADAAVLAEHEAHWQALVPEWKAAVEPIYTAIRSANADAQVHFPPWEPARWSTWKPATEFAHAAPFARLDVNVAQLAGALPADPRLTLPGPAKFSVPLLLTYPAQGSILFETATTGREEMIGALNNIVLRLLSVAPPGRVRFTILDPVGLGQSFSGIMHLADYAEHLINSRIWTQTTHIEQRLADLNEHMEKVIQMYLRNEYATIAEYNEQAGNIAEKYHFLVVADFPANFTETAAKRLLSIAASGARCGVYTLIHRDRRQPVPQEFAAEDLKKNSVCLASRGGHFVLGSQDLPGVALVLEAPPPPDFATEFIHKVGLANRDSNRVEVPFAHVTPADDALWTLETTSELRVPIGRTGATKLQYLAIGKGTCQHALLAGKTGSGKSTLFHVMITNLALWCSPEQVEFYLVDFKKGVEFKCYATRRLPHARVVAIESDREFGLSVLQRLDDELKRRGDLFRHRGVQDVPGYKKAGGTEPMPRCLLIIDEFQEFFVEDDKIAQTASMLLDRIVRQGRAFGIHVFLGSQTLGGAYTVARTTLGQMVIRIALQCNEADAYLIMDDSNPAPRLLSRPGEGIYNDTAGTLEGNSPFQVVWLPDDVRDAYLDKVVAQAQRSGTAYPGPIVFEGNAPADVRENPLLRALLEAPAIRPAPAARCWLGAPNSIKGPTEAVFHRQSGNHLLMVGQREEAALAILSVALVALAAQYPRAGARFVLLDGTVPGQPARDYLARLVRALPHPIAVVKQNEVPAVMAGLAADMQRRNSDDQSGTAPPVFLFIHGLQKFSKLRYEEDFGFAGGEDAEAAPKPDAVLNQLICEGPSLGFHVFATCDTYNNVNRCLSKKAFSEFEMRVLFQMSANDSASLIDSPKAGTLGLHRALYYNEQEGYLETFRPYALPARDWVDEATRQLARRLP